MNKFRRVFENVLKQIVPSREEEENILKLAEDFKRRVENCLRSAGLQAIVRIEGSVAKGTWLKGDVDLDIFMLLNPEVSKEEIKAKYIEHIKKAFPDLSWSERYAEHPYLETKISGMRVNLVPCYMVKKGKWISSTDRTPYHTQYIKSKLTDELRNEIRLMKKFTKSLGVYGAEIKIGGFSGYLCELLVIYYGSFLELLRNAVSWKEKTIIDVEGLFRNEKVNPATIFRSPLIVIDPVDKRRNVASALAREKLSEFISAAKVFLENPSENFFFLKPPEPLPLTGILDRIANACLVLIRFQINERAPDILWGQLRKSLNAIKMSLEQNDFKVIKSGIWSDEKKQAVFVFKLESCDLPPSKKHMGPPVISNRSFDFLSKHLASDRTVSGPWIEGGRWYVEIKRKKTNVREYLRELLEKDGGKSIGVSADISNEIKNSFQLIVNEEILDLYQSRKDFAVFLTEFVIGQPLWLVKYSDYFRRSASKGENRDHHK